MPSRHVLIVVSTVCDDAIWWMTVAMPFGRLFGTFWSSLVDIHTLIHHSSNSLDVSSYLWCTCSCTDHPPSLHTCRYTRYPPWAQCTYHLQLLSVFAGFPPGMLSAPSPGELVTTSLGMHIIIFWVCLSFHLHVHWLTLLHVFVDSGSYLFHGTLIN